MNFSPGRTQTLLFFLTHWDVVVIWKYNLPTHVMHEVHACFLLNSSQVNDIDPPVTHWGRNQIDAISQTPFSNKFSWMKIYEFRLKFHWSLFPSLFSRPPLVNDKSTLIHVMAWCRLASSHYMSQCWPRPLSPYGFTWPQWVNRILHK